MVDEKEIIQTWPETEQAVHTGKGYDLGNTNTIAIEICRSTSSENLYLKAQDKAVELIKELKVHNDAIPKVLEYSKSFLSRQMFSHFTKASFSMRSTLFKFILLKDVHPKNVHISTRDNVFGSLTSKRDVQFANAYFESFLSPLLPPRCELGPQ